MPVQPDVQRHMQPLDGVRGIAVLLVMMHHAYQFAGMRHPIDRAVDVITSTGWVGVDLFFVLSGFLITGILLDARDSPWLFRAFYARRALRIFPLYYVYLAVCLVLLPALLGESLFPKAEAKQLWLWTYLANYTLAFGFLHRPLNHLWSLAVEEQFYLVWPAVVWTLGRRRLVPVLMVLLPAVCVLRAWMDAAGYSGQAIYMLTWTRIDALAMGALVAAVARGPGGLLYWRPMAIAVLAFVLPGLALYAWPDGGLGYAGNPRVASGLMYSGIAASCAALIVLLLTAEPSWRTRLLSRGLLPTLGKYSYAMYILHMPVDIGLREAGIHPNGWTTAADFRTPAFVLYMEVFTTLTLLAAMGSWHILEKHFLRLKKYVPYRPPQQTETTSEAV